MSVILDIRHKLKTQDIFRASTVLALLAEYDMKSARVAELEQALEQAREVIAPFAEAQTNKTHFEKLTQDNLRRAADWLIWCKEK